METMNQILLVDNHSSSNVQIDAKIRKTGLASNVKIAMNGGHALLYLEQVCDKLRESNLVILLNMDTPIMNGSEFIQNFNMCKSICKDKIMLVVLNDGLTDNRINAIRALGVSNFISKDFDPSVLSDMIRVHFRKISPSIQVKTKFNGSDNRQRMNAA